MTVYHYHHTLMDFVSVFYFDENLISLEEFDKGMKLGHFPVEQYLHREDGPAWIGDVGDWWYHHGIKHRIDGPAEDNTKSGDSTYYYLNNEHYSFEEWLELTPIPDEQKIELKLKYME